MRKDLGATVAEYKNWKVTERQDVEVCGVHIIHIYRPSAVGLQKADTRRDDFDTEELPCGDNVVIAGDLNAHHPTWSAAKTPNTVGTQLNDWAQEHGMRIYNTPESSTRIVGENATSPDVVVASDWNPVQWRVLNTGSSDHLPMEFDVPCEHLTEPQHRDTTNTKPLWNWKEADWEAYCAEMERSADGVSGWKDATTAYARWAHTLLEVAKRHIPRHRRRKRKRRWCDKKVQKAIRERDTEIGRQQRTPPAQLTKDDGTTLTRLRREVTNQIRRAKREVWEARATDASRTNGAFNLLRELDGRADKAQPYPLLDEGDPLTTDRQKADCLGRLYAATSGGGGVAHPDEPLSAPQLPPESAKPHPSEAPFTRAELDIIIHSLADKKTPGPDGVHNEFLKHLGPRAREGLLHICNLSWVSGRLPKEWTQATLFPIHKPGKPASDPNSYRPIALTSGASKVMERMIAKRLTQLMEDPTEPMHNLNDVQAGFRRHRSAVDNVAMLTQLARDALAEGRSAILLTVDMEKAYDTVSRDAILRRLKEMNTPARYLRWFTSYLDNRRATTTVCGTHGDTYHMAEGVPQGTVLSPLLFNCAMAEVANTLSAHCKGYTAIYADDLAILLTGDDIDDTTAKTETALGLLEECLPRLGFRLSRDKTSFLPFVSRRDAEGIRKTDLPLTYSDGSLVKRGDRTKYLGVLIDETCSMTAHLEQVKITYRRRLALLHMLAGRDWGCDAHTLRQVYLTYVLPAVTYAICVWGIALTNKAFGELETIHRRAARLITGCAFTTDTAELLWEAHLPTLEEKMYTEAATAYERIRRVGGSPGSTAIQKASRTAGSTWLRLAESVVKRTAIYTRSPGPATIISHYPVAPWEWQGMLGNIQIHPAIPGLSRSDPDQTDAERYAMAQVMLAGLPQAELHAYTDGSVKEGVGGAGVVLLDPSTTDIVDKRSVGAGQSCVSYQAELVALREATQMIAARGVARVVILTDSQSALHALEAGPHRAKAETLVDVWRGLATLTSSGTTVTLQYVPAHVGVEGNELADYQAGLRTNNHQLQTEPITLLAAKAAVRRVTAERTPRPGEKSLYAWTPPKSAGPTARRPALHTPALTRLGASTMRLLRTRRHYLLFDYMSKNRAPKCPMHGCTVQKTTLKHLLRTCPKLKDLREKHLDNLSPHVLLLTRPVTTLRFLMDAGLLHETETELLTKRGKG